jgi:hypothetical protein
MTRKNLSICIALMTLLLGCSRNESNEDGNHIVLVGDAINLKEGAGVLSSETIYLIDDLVSWDEKSLNKKVRVEGELFVELLPPPPQTDTINVPPPPPPQRGSYDFRLIIKKPRW